MREEIFQDTMRRKAEAKLIATISENLPDGLISSALEIYLNNPWMEEEIFSCDILTDDDINECIRKILLNIKLPS